MTISWQTKRSRELEKLILEGVNLTRHAQEGDALYSSNQFLAVDIHNSFVSWRQKIKDFVSKNYPYKVALTFFEADSVPHFKGGIEYGDVTSNKSQILLRSIREETTRKLSLLRQLEVKWHQTWWGKSAIGIMVAIISGFIIA